MSRDPSGRGIPPIGTSTGGSTTSKGGTTTSEPPRPFVKPGEQLGFAQKLKQKDAWPPKRKKPEGRRKGPTITPFIVVQSTAADLGVRPIPTQQAVHNLSVEIVDSTNTPVVWPVAHTTYHVRARVWNRGGAGAFGGMAEFYIAPRSVIDAVVAAPGTALGPTAYVGFTAQPGATALVTCPKPWTPANDAEAASTIVVQAYDVFVDPVTKRFDAKQDRHVGRRDAIPHLSGIWDGMESGNVIHQTPTKIRIAITQNLLNVTVSFFSQVGGVIPATPQETGTGVIVGDQVQISTSENLGGKPFHSSQWTLSLTAAGQLHFEHHGHYLAPGDGRPDTFTTGNLTRI